MKKIVLLLAIAAFAASVVSCKMLLPVSFEKFVDYVEKNADSFTEEDWKKTDESFQKLMEEYKANYDDLSQEDHERIDKAIGRYYGIAVKSGFNNIVNSVDEALDGLKQKAQGVLDGIGSWLDELGK